MLNPNGITPAYAGKSPYPVALTLSGGDHPRVCGEKTIYVDTYPGTLGSPPRMRGKVAVIVSHACNTKDHPRVCGEKQAERGSIETRQGSPPRMRGKGQLPSIR